MDRISAMRNVEEALREFEAGEADLAATEETVLAVLRTYATNFEEGDGRRAYRARGDDPVDGVVVIAGSPDAAAELVRTVAGAPDAAFDVEPL